MMNDRAMFAMGLPGGMREIAPTDEEVHDKGAAPEISVGSAVDLDAVVIELKTAANASAKPKETPSETFDTGDTADMAELPLEDAALAFAPLAAPRAGGSGHGGKSLSLATLGSLLMHTAALALALHVITELPEAPAEEGSTVVSVIMVGNGDVDAAAGGVEPTIVEAKPVQAETASAVEVPPLETPALEPLPLQAAEPAPQAMPPESTPPAETAVAPPVEVAEAVPPSNLPPVLAAAPTDALTPTEIAPAPPVVQQAVPPAEIAAAPPIESATPLVTQTSPTEMIKAELDDPAFDIEAPVPPPSPWKTEPLPKDQVATRKAAEKPAPKRVVKQTSAGSSGQANRDARKGVASGTANTGAADAAKAAAGTSGNGNAAMANYAGKLRAKLRRSGCRRALLSRHWPASDNGYRECDAEPLRQHCFTAAGEILWQWQGRCHSPAARARCLLPSGHFPQVTLAQATISRCPYS